MRKGIGKGRRMGEWERRLSGGLGQARQAEGIYAVRGSSTSPPSVAGWKKGEKRPEEREAQARGIYERGSLGGMRKREVRRR